MAGKGKNETSIWVWLLVHIVMSIPGAALIMALYWAFNGGNATFRNYFRAYLLLCLLLVGFFGLLATFGLIPSFREWVQGVAHSIYQLAEGKTK